MPKARSFDYVIVGAGSAGCVLANRLSAEPGVRVLLLEAGGWDWHPLVRAPLGVGRIWGFDRFDWGYRAVSGAATGHRMIEAARGKIIGGSHSINAMGYIRGNQADYDRWRGGVCPDGRSAKFFPTSNARKPGRTAKTNTEAAAGRSMCGAPRTSIRSTKPTSPPASRRGIPIRTITMAHSSMVSAGPNGPSVQDCVTRRRAPIFIRRSDAAT